MLNKSLLRAFLAVSIFSNIGFPVLAQAGEFSLQLKLANTPFQDSLSPQEAITIQAFLKDAEDALPPSLKKELGKTIHVELKSFNQDQTLELPACGANKNEKPTHDQTYGETAGSESLRLNSLFIPEILAGAQHSRTYPCGLHNLYRLALGTLLHEVAHLYDEGRSTAPASSDPFYQRVAGWKTRTSLKEGIFREPRPKNLITTRSPEAYEVLDINEHFAVNFPYFLLDPEYRCRRPALFSYLSRSFDFTPQLPDCEINTDLPLTRTDIFSDDENQQDLPVRIDLSRVYEIHFLPALTGRNIFSRWGHAMFRIVLCAPNTPMGPQCRLDISHHLVLSYSALIEDAKINAWSGLTGGYPSQAFIVPLEEMIEQYTRGEFRNVWSLPIQMTEEQKRNFVLTALEHYWGYRGDYYFLSNNCNTESVDLLKGIYCTPQMEKFSPWTPLSMISKLDALGLIDKDLMNDEAKGRTAGLFFPSVRPQLERDFLGLRSYLREAGHERVMPWKKLEKYLDTSTSAQRSNMITLLQGAPPKLLAKFRSLETYLASRLETRFKSRTFALLEKTAHSAPAEGSLEKSLYEAHVLVLQQTRAAAAPKRGYGIPMAKDFDRGVQLPTIPEDVLAIYSNWQREHFPQDWSELRGIETNLATVDH